MILFYKNVEHILCNTTFLTGYKKTNASEGFKTSVAQTLLIWNLLSFLHYCWTEAFSFKKYLLEYYKESAQIISCNFINFSQTEHTYVNSTQIDKQNPTSLQAAIPVTASRQF